MKQVRELFASINSDVKGHSTVEKFNFHNNRRKLKKKYKKMRIYVVYGYFFVIQKLIVIYINYSLKRFLYIIYDGFKKLPIGSF